MKISLDIRKTIDENAAEFFNKAKKAKKKILGAKKALVRSTAQFEKEEAKEHIIVESKVKKIRKKDWFEKFRWFMSSDNFMIIAGRDATTNEIIIKKYCEEGDLVLHTDMAGSPFTVIKSENKEIPKTTISEAADLTVSFGRGWKKGLSTTEVFYVKPDQVSKDAKAGESLTKGAFMIYGDTKYIDNKINVAIGVYNDRIMSGPISAIKKHCKEFVEIIQGERKSSDIAKIVNKKLGGKLDLDEIIRALPPGNCELKRDRSKK